MRVSRLRFRPVAGLNFFNRLHGAQQLSFFNHHYDTYCYLPVVGFLSFDKEPDQYLVTAVLRPGNAHDSVERSEFCAG